MTEDGMNDMAQLHSLMTSVVTLSRLRDDVRAAAVQAQAVFARFMYIIDRNRENLTNMYGEFEMTRIVQYCKQSADYVTEILDNDAKAALWLKQAELTRQ